MSEPRLMRVANDLASASVPTSLCSDLIDRRRRAVQLPPAVIGNHHRARAAAYGANGVFGPMIPFTAMSAPSRGEPLKIIPSDV